MGSNYIAMCEAIAVARPIESADDHARDIRAAELWSWYRDSSCTMVQRLAIFESDLDDHYNCP